MLVRYVQAIQDKLMDCMDAKLVKFLKAVYVEYYQGHREHLEKLEESCPLDAQLEEQDTHTYAQAWRLAKALSIGVKPEDSFGYADALKIGIRKASDSTRTD